MRPFNIYIIRLFTILCLISFISWQSVEFLPGSLLQLHQQDNNSVTSETASIHLDDNNDIIILGETITGLMNVFGNEKIFLPADNFIVENFIFFIWQPPKMS